MLIALIEFKLTREKSNEQENFTRKHNKTFYEVSLDRRS